MPYNVLRLCAAAFSHRELCKNAAKYLLRRECIAQGIFNYKK
jgi:hypothetical protein